VCGLIGVDGRQRTNILQTTLVQREIHFQKFWLCANCNAVAKPPVWFCNTVLSDKGNTRGYVFGRNDLDEFWALALVGSRIYDSGIYDAFAEAAAAVLWLASPEAGFTIGHDLVIDGGATA